MILTNVVLTFTNILILFPFFATIAAVRKYHRVDFSYVPHDVSRLTYQLIAVEVESVRVMTEVV